ncbi:MAG: RHS repeat-associated core domain-containing protein [Nanoarchaeota archaeon]
MKANPSTLLLSSIVLFVLVLGVVSFSYQETVRGLASLPLSPTKDVNIPLGQPLTGSGGTTYVYGNSLIASKKDTTLTYHVQDFLSTNRLTTTAEGLMQSKYVSYPYGTTLTKESFSSGVQKYTFTGKEDDGHLMYFGARYLDARTGRFISIDPITSTHANYDYADDNPLRFADPNGKRAKEMGKLAEGIGAGTLDSIRNLPQALKAVVENPALLLDLPKNAATAARASFPENSLFGFGTAQDPYVAGKAASSIILTLLGAQGVISGGFPLQLQVTPMPSLAMATSTGGTLPLAGGMAISLTASGPSALGTIALLREAGESASGEQATSAQKPPAEERVTLYRVDKSPKQGGVDPAGPWTTEIDEAWGMYNEGMLNGNFVYRYRTTTSDFTKNFQSSGNGYVPLRMAEERIKPLGRIEKVMERLEE